MGEPGERAGSTPPGLVSALSQPLPEYFGNVDYDAFGLVSLYLKLHSAPVPFCREEEAEHVIDGGQHLSGWPVGLE